MKLHISSIGASMPTVLCIHHDDLDGLGSAHLVNKFEKGHIEFKQMNYKDKYDLKDFTKYDKVIIVDFSLPMEDMKKLGMQVDLVWIDHHLSAIKDAEKHNLTNLRGIQKDGTAGCQLTWQYYTDKPQPLYIELLGEFDVWKNGEKDGNKYQQQKWFNYIVPFQLYCLSHKNRFHPESEWWDALPTEHSEDSINMFKIGMGIRNYQSIQMQEACTNFAFTTKLEGKRVICLNTTNLGSANFDNVPKEHYDIMCVYRWDGEQYTFSLYSTDSNIDCGAICKKYGGGGHKGAAGFTSDKLPWTTTQRWRS